MSYNEVVDPPWFSPLIFAPAIRREILNRLQQTLPKHLMEKLENLYGGEEYSAEHWTSFQRHLRAFDEMRDLNVVDYFPELNAFLASKGLALRA